MARPARCAIVVPVHGKAALTRQCIDALLREQRTTAAELVVVDDGSTDGTDALLREYGDAIVHVRHGEPLGFAASCNDGAAATAGELVCFLNNDVVPCAGWLDELVAELDAHAEAAVAGAKLLYPDRTVQHAGVVVCLDGIPRHLYRGFPADHPGVDRSRAFQAVTGACMLVRRAAFEAAGGFDQSYRNGYEDVDLCLRLREAGQTVRYCHRSVLYHLESVSRGSRFDEHNQALWDERWRHRVTVDEFSYYAEDGLVEAEYAAFYPLRLSVAPEVAVIDVEGVDESWERLVSQRAGQVWDALRDNIALAVELNERHAGAVPAVPASPRLERRRAAAEPEPVANGRIHVLGAGGPLVSICLPVKDGGPRLVRLLDAVLAQEADCRLELVAIDSGSTDGSVEALVDRGARVARISPEDFNHGRTRNLLAELADGDPLVYLSQRAVPDGPGWLAPLLAAMDEDATLAGAASRMVPPEGFSVLAQRDVVRDLNGSPTPSVRALAAGEAAELTPHDLRVRINFHTVSAALRRELVVRFPFREMRTIGEDVQWARDALEAGFRIRHEPASVVQHGDDAPLWTVLGRNVDDGLANRDVVGRTMPRADVLPAIEHLVRDDWSFLAEVGLEGEELEREQIAAVLRRAVQVVGQYVGCNADELPPGLVASLSEVTRRVGGAGELP